MMLYNVNQTTLFIIFLITFKCITAYYIHYLFI